MYQEERLGRITELLKKAGTLSNREVAEAFGISRDTARRDIVRLTEMGVATRTHGGITVSRLGRGILSYKERCSENTGEKGRIAALAAGFLKERQMCFFDASTTVEMLCARVPCRLEAYTNSLRNLGALQSSPCGLHLLGGDFNRYNQFLYGSETLEQLDRIRFDCAFLGVAAVGEDGFYVEDEEDAGLKRKVVQRSSLVVVLADHTKFVRQSRFRAAEFGQVHLLLTDEKPPEPAATRLRNAGVQWEVSHEGDKNGRPKV